MKRSMFTIGLLAVIGCGGVENQAAEPSTSAAQTESTPAVAAPEVEEVATPRVARFALMPASAIQHGSIPPASWAAKDSKTLPAIEQDERGTFEPDMLRVVEELRRQQKFPGGVQ